MNRANNILWGLTCIVGGVIVSLNLLGMLDFELFFDGWWTLLLIVPNAISLITSSRNKKTYAIGLFAGIILLLDAQGVLEAIYLLKLIIPVAIIIYGIYLIKKSIPVRKKRQEDNNCGL